MTPSTSNNKTHVGDYFPFKSVESFPLYLKLPAKVEGVFSFSGSVNINKKNYDYISVFRVSLLYSNVMKM